MTVHMTQGGVLKNYWVHYRFGQEWAHHVVYENLFAWRADFQVKTAFYILCYRILKQFLIMTREYKRNLLS